MPCRDRGGVKQIAFRVLRERYYWPINLFPPEPTIIAEIREPQMWPAGYFSRPELRLRNTPEPVRRCRCPLGSLSSGGLLTQLHLPLGAEKLNLAALERGIEHGLMVAMGR